MIGVSDVITFVPRLCVHFDIDKKQLLNITCLLLWANPNTAHMASMSRDSICLQILCMQKVDTFLKRRDIG